MATTTTTEETPALTSTTAPGKVFASRSELATHYKSPWHKYNLKRREAGLPPLLEGDFQARLQAAQEALAQQQQQSKSADAHLKKGKKHKQKKTKKNAEQPNGSATLSSQVPAYDRIKKEQEAKDATTEEATTADNADNNHTTTNDTAMATEEQELSPEEQMMQASQQIEIDPRQCLFDRHISASVHDNITRMQRKYGFFVPDQECLIDAEGLVGYCHEKIQIGRLCLYCQKVFKSGEACQKHMVSTRHTKLRYEPNVDLDEFTVFYDFENANQEFLLSGGVAKSNTTAEDMDVDDEANSDEEWEDISDDDADADAEVTEEEIDEEDEEMMDGYEREVAALGLDVTPLGELIFPDGRIVGHRSFRRYYKQRAPRTNDNRVSVAAARHAAGDRIYQGRIVNLHDVQNAAGTNNTALAARQAGIKPSLLAGGVGKGILVSSGGSGGGFTQVSIYRYRAAIQKERRQASSGKRLQDRSKLPMNKMDKKHNRLMNGVSVAHAKR